MPPVLQNMNEEQIADVFDTMFSAVRQTRQANEQAPGQPGGYGQLGVPAHAQPQAQPPQPSFTPQQLNEAYKQLLDPNNENFNPQLAFGDYVQRNFGQLLGNINQRSIIGAMSGLRTKIPDFADYEQDIMRVLSQRDPATLNDNDIMGTYYAVKGYRATEKDRQRANQPTTLTPTPTDTNAVPDPKKNLSDVERTVARAMFRGSADPEAEYLKELERDGMVEVKVPIGGGKKS